MVGFSSGHLTHCMCHHGRLVSWLTAVLLVCVRCVGVQHPLNQLKDLVDLKDQLEDLQRRVEDEVQAGVPAVRCASSVHYAKQYLL